LKAIKPKSKDKTIKLTLSFRAERKGKGRVFPKRAWSSGWVQIKANKSQGIAAQRSQKFNSFADIPMSIQRALIASGITILLCRREGQLFEL
jgi:hypothetical protein